MGMVDGDCFQRRALDARMNTISQMCLVAPGLIEAIILPIMQRLLYKFFIFRE